MQAYLPFLFVSSFVAIWCCISWVVAKVSGWAQLAKTYPMPKVRTNETRFYCKSIRMKGNSKFKNCVNFGVSDEGLRLSMMFLFRFGSPPILIPWENLLSSKETVLKIFVNIRLVPTKHQDIVITMDQGLARKLAKASDGCWPNPENTL